jgi:hypothetical protein
MPEQDLAVKVAELTLKVEALGGQLDRLEGHRDSEPGEYCWKDLSAAQQRALWSELADWVSWLVGRYDLQERVPACWVRHPAFVEELTALYAGWRHAYQAGTGATGSAPLDWQEALAKALGRIKEHDQTGCASGTHREPYPVDWQSDPPPASGNDQRPDAASPANRPRH